MGGRSVERGRRSVVRRVGPVLIVEPTSDQRLRLAVRTWNRSACHPSALYGVGSGG